MRVPGAGLREEKGAVFGCRCSVFGYEEEERESVGRGRVERWAVGRVAQIGQVGQVGHVRQVGQVGRMRGGGEEDGFGLSVLGCRGWGRSDLRAASFKPSMWFRVIVWPFALCDLCWLCVRRGLGWMGG